jgi:hypothetical protein
VLEEGGEATLWEALHTDAVFDGLNDYLRRETP